MGMVSMKAPQEESMDTAMAEAPVYPYGLCLQLDENALKALGFDGLPQVGQTIAIRAMVTVQSASSYQATDGDQELSSSWQITDMEVLNPTDAAASLYG